MDSEKPKLDNAFDVLVPYSCLKLFIKHMEIKGLCVRLSVITPSRGTCIDAVIENHLGK